ncbi:MAG: hypothetical protein M3155_03140 [Actinomycetota bacterium]|nr:hypothetical protein [Actinomycetota bacterium]
MPRRLFALLVLVALVLGGCGNGSGTSKSAKKVTRPPAAAKTLAQSVRATAALTVAPPSKRRSAARAAAAPQPVEQLSDALTAFRLAAREGSCAKLLPLRHSGERGGVAPGSAPTQQECADFTANVLPLVKDEVPVANESFGTAAVVDYTQNGKDLTGLWLVEADGHWRYLVNGQFLTHSVGTRPAPSDLFDEGVNGFISAAQSRDCAGTFRFLNADSPFLFGGKTQDQWCTFVTPLFTTKNNFFAAAVANPSAKPRPLGGTRLYGLYDIDFGNSSYWILVGKLTPSNVPEAQKQGHVANGFQSMYSASFAPS